MIAVGLMSGTSLDGIDAALLRLQPTHTAYQIELLRFQTFAFDDDLLERLLAALPPNPGSVGEVAALHGALGAAFARAARAIAGDVPVDYVASHGQTMFHDGAGRSSLQIGAPFAIRSALEASGCFDFRSADIAEGGQGAPLVPYVDALLLHDANEDRVALNLGGIANLTALPRRGEPIAFDSGPGNMPLDAFVRSRTGDPRAFDRDGRLSGAGRCDAVALDEMLKDPYFAMRPPKSTGRERFGDGFLRGHAATLAQLSLEDGAATLAALAVESAARAIREVGFSHARILVAGGGAHNPTMMGGLAQRLPDARVEASDAMGLPVDAKEALAFAVLGYETLRARAANVPSITGARRAVPLGAIAPWRLEELLAKVREECRLS